MAPKAVQPLSKHFDAAQMSSLTTLESGPLWLLWLLSKVVKVSRAGPDVLLMCWAIHIAHRHNLKGRIVIYTDNLNTVEIFDRLHVPAAERNPILLSAVDVLINDPFAIRVAVDSDQSEGNEIANALSQGQIDRLRRRLLDISIVNNEPLPVLPSYNAEFSSYSSLLASFSIRPHL